MSAAGFEHEPAYPPNHAHLPGGNQCSRRVADDGGHTAPPLQTFRAFRHDKTLLCY
jgi:hypothetical protein